MCGISGIFKLKGNNDLVIPDQLQDMLSLITYRGPDESGIYLGENIGLGHVRLSIIDLETGTQPLSDQSGNFWITYNGEIFNYLELKSELISLGYHFKTTSDTEVIVQLYAHYGRDCLGKLNGQFAFAIWDKRKKELFLARDRAGIRPLYYSVRNSEFIFASEVKSLLAHLDFKAEVSTRSLLQVITLWSPLPSGTFFENISQIRPGHYMLVKSDGSIADNCYWKVSPVEKRDFNIKMESEELLDLLLKSTELRLRSDVQVGAYLSGGLDSTLTTRLIKQLDSNVLNTFSITFDQTDFDESNYQNEAVDFLDTKHIAVQCTTNDIAEYLPEVISHTELPILRTSPVPMYLLSRLVRESGIKVAITGEGADEMFGGYNIFKELKIRLYWSRFPDSKKRPTLLRELYPYIPHLRDAEPLLYKLFFGYRLEETNNPFYSHLIRWNNASKLKNLLKGDILDKLKHYNLFDELSSMLPSDFEQWGHFNKAQYLESSIFMGEYLLSSQGDRVGMANSVEGRYPFLDHRIIEYSYRMPDRYKLFGLNEKFIIKHLSQKIIPESIRIRTKQPYRAPVFDLLNSDNHPVLADAVSKKKIEQYGIFDYKACNKLRIELKNKKYISEVDNMAMVFMMSTQLLLGYWNRLKVDKNRYSKPITPIIIDERNKNGT